MRLLTVDRRIRRWMGWLALILVASLLGINGATTKVNTPNAAIEQMTKYQLGRSLAKQQIELIAEFLGTLTGEYRGKPL